MLIEELAAALAMSVAYVGTAALLLVGGVTSLVRLVLELIFSLIFRDRSARADSVSAAAGSGRARLLALLRSRWVRRVGIASGVCFGLTLAAVLALNFLFFDWSVRKLLAGAAARSGIDVAFAEADGNLLTGRIRLTGVTLVRREDPLTVFDVRADELEIDLSVPSMLWGDRRVEHVRAAGLRGTVERLAKGQPKPWYAKRNMHIDRLDVSDAEIAWIDHSRPRDAVPVTVNLVIDKFSGERLRTRWLAFDLLFRTNGDGRVEGQPFAVTNEQTPAGGGRAVWRFDELPAALLGDYVGGPLAWLNEGRADVVATTLYGDPGRGLEMDWRVVLSDVSADVPPTLDGWRLRLGKAFVRHLNDHGERLPLAFTFQLNAEGFDGAASAEAAGLWTAVADAATSEIAQAVNVEPEQVEKLRSQAAEKLRTFRRKRVKE